MSDAKPSKSSSVQTEKCSFCAFLCRKLREYNYSNNLLAYLSEMDAQDKLELTYNVVSSANAKGTDVGNFVFSCLNMTPSMIKSRVSSLFSEMQLHRYFSSSL